MKRSTNRILTTHGGRMPNPSNIQEFQKAKADGEQKRMDEAMKNGIAEVVRKQVDVDVDVLCDGEFWKARDKKYWERFSGVELRPLKPGESASILAVSPERVEPEFKEFYEILNQLGSAPRPGVLSPNILVGTGMKSVIKGPQEYLGPGPMQHDIQIVKAGLAAAGVKPEDCFFPVLGPGWMGHFLWNEYYKTEEEYVYAMANAWRGEFQAVVNAGFILQIDDPGLADKFALFNPPLTIEQYRKHAALRIEATNHALQGIPEEQVRYHTCWGSWHGPHTHDIPFQHIVDLLLKVHAQGYSVEASNVQHMLDWKVWQQTKLPAGKVYIPGVVGHATGNLVENPEVVADRAVTYGKIMGRENVIAGTDCGLGNRTYDVIAWAKFKMLAEGSRLATKELWRK